MKDEGDRIIFNPKNYYSVFIPVIKEFLYINKQIDNKTIVDIIDFCSGRYRWFIYWLSIMDIYNIFVKFEKERFKHLEFKIVFCSIFIDKKV